MSLTLHHNQCYARMLPSKAQPVETFAPTAPLIPLITNSEERLTTLIATESPAAVQALREMWRGYADDLTDEDLRAAMQTLTIPDSATQSWQARTEAMVAAILLLLWRNALLAGGISTVETNDALLAYLSERARFLSTYLVARQRMALLRILRASAVRHLGGDALARVLRAYIGLTPQDMASLERLRAVLTDDKVPNDRILAILEQRAANMRQRRAVNLTEHELATVFNWAQHYVVSQRLLEQTVGKVTVYATWHTWQDEKVCPTCWANDGQTFRYGGFRDPATEVERFQYGDGRNTVLQLIAADGSAQDPPPLHFRCRCTLTYANQRE